MQNRWLQTLNENNQSADSDEYVTIDVSSLNTPEPLALDEDLKYCSISKEIMFHPVLASDGKHYELCELARWFQIRGLISPITNEPILSVTYDFSLKTTLDNNYLISEDRHLHYDKGPIFADIRKYFEKPKHQFLYHNRIDNLPAQPSPLQNWKNTALNAFGLCLLIPTLIYNLAYIVEGETVNSRPRDPDKTSFAWKMGALLAMLYLACVFIKRLSQQSHLPPAHDSLNERIRPPLL